MDKDLFIENIIHFSTLKREYPTKACEAAGVGKSFVSDIRRGQVPSVEKVLLSLSFFHCGNVVFYFLQSSYFVPFFCDEFITCAKL